MVWLIWGKKKKWALQKIGSYLHRKITESLDNISFWQTPLRLIFSRSGSLLPCRGPEKLPGLGLLCCLPFLLSTVQSWWDFLASYTQVLSLFGKLNKPTENYFKQNGTASDAQQHESTALLTRPCQQKQSATSPWAQGLLSSKPQERETVCSSVAYLSILLHLGWRVSCKCGAKFHPAVGRSSKGAYHGAAQTSWEESATL